MSPPIRTNLLLIYHVHSLEARGQQAPTDSNKSHFAAAGSTSRWRFHRRASVVISRHILGHGVGMATNEAFSRVKIDAQLKDAGWNLSDGRSVHFEYVLPDGTKADYALCSRRGHSLAVLEAKRASINPVEAERQAKDYARQLAVPFIFLANGEEVWFWEWETEAHPRQVKTVFSFVHTSFCKLIAC